jgi:hypothetical protein
MCLSVKTPPQKCVIFQSTWILQKTVLPNNQQFNGISKKVRNVLPEQTILSKLVDIWLGWPKTISRELATLQKRPGNNQPCMQTSTLCTIKKAYVSTYMKTPYTLLQEYLIALKSLKGNRLPDWYGFGFWWHVYKDLGIRAATGF